MSFATDDCAGKVDPLSRALIELKSCGVPHSVGAVDKVVKNYG